MDSVSRRPRAMKVMCARSLSISCPLARPRFSKCRRASRTLQTRWRLGRNLPMLSYCQPRILVSSSNSSSSWTVSPAHRSSKTARRKRLSTSSRLVPITCKLSTYCTCQNFPSGGAQKSWSRSEGRSPALSAMRSWRRWHHHKAHAHPIGNTAIRGVRRSDGRSLFPLSSVRPISFAVTDLRQKNFLSSSGIFMV